MSLFRRNLKKPSTELDRYSFDQWATQFGFAGNQYLAGLGQQTYSSWQGGERIGNSFEAYARSAYQSNGVVFACILARQLVFSEARFQFRTYTGGRPGDLYGTPALELLERPWPNGTTGELLSRMEQDASLAGNCYLVVRNGRVRRLRPDWVTIVVGSESEPDASLDIDSTVLGYLYHPAGNRDAPAVVFDAGDVAHYSPIPDPLATYRGMSWITTILREIQADVAATTHKWKFFENGATPNLILKSEMNLQQGQAERVLEMFNQRHRGADNAYKTLVLGGGLDATIVGHSFEQMNFKTVQGAGETRIAAASGVPPVIVGLSEGLAASTYSNYAQARRRFADGTIRPLWRIAAASLETLVTPPAGSHLWYSDQDIPFLREDSKDAADIQSVQAQSIKALTDAGYDPDSVVGAVTAGDLRRLKGAHSGLYSVQLQPPGASAPNAIASGTDTSGPPALPPADVVEVPGNAA